MARPRDNLSQLGQELEEDLPQLVKDHPEGVTFATLMEWFGWHQQRVRNVCSYLASSGRIKMQKTTYGTYQILPKDFIPEPFYNLSPLQRRLMNFLIEHAQKSPTHQVRSSYAQIASIIDASYGGIRAVIHGLIEQDLLQVDVNSTRGRTNQLVLTVSVDGLPLKAHLKKSSNSNIIK